MASPADAETVAAELGSLLKDNPAHLPILQETLKHAAAKNKDGKFTSEVSGVVAPDAQHSSCLLIRKFLPSSFW